MELSLNICWLLLMAPALCWWIRNRRVSRDRFSLVALACLLFLLFPVISASDDLHAMRPEIEDSSTNKRSLRHAGIEKASAQNFGSPPAQLVFAIFLSPYPEMCGLIGEGRKLMPVHLPLQLNEGRAPPFSFM
jgi:hypothetical protein